MVQFLSLRIVDICVRVLLLQDFAFLDPHTKISIIFLPMEVFGAWKIPLPAYQTRFFMNFVYSAPSSTRLIMIESALLFTICKFIKSCLNSSDKWVKLFKNRSSKTCARQSLKNASADHVTSNFWKAVFHKLYLVHSSIPWPK